MQTGKQILYKIIDYIKIAKLVINHSWNLDDAKDVLEDQYNFWYQNYYLQLSDLKAKKLQWETTIINARTAYLSHLKAHLAYVQSLINQITNYKLDNDRRIKRIDVLGKLADDIYADDELDNNIKVRGILAAQAEIEKLTAESQAVLNNINTDLEKENEYIAETDRLKAALVKLQQNADLMIILGNIWNF